MKVLASLSLLLVAGLTLANGTPSSAEVISKASASAKKSGKNVLVIFHASWCGWCHKLDDFLDKTDEGKLVKNGLEVVHITVLENDPKQKPNENAGGVELMEKLGGKDAGLPFMAILDAKSGKMIINSIATDPKGKVGNTGYPAAPHEVAHFMKMLGAGAQKIGKGDLVKINTWLTKNAPPQ